MPDPKNQDSIKSDSRNWPATSTSLILALQAGDRRAWDEFARTYSKPIMERMRSECLRRGWSPDVGEDIAQDILANMPKLVGKYTRDKGSFRAWLKTVLSNRLIDKYRRKKHSPTNISEQEAAGIVDFFAETFVEKLYEVIRRDVQKDVGETHWKIADALGIEDGRSKIGGPRKTLKEVADEHSLSIFQVQRIRRDVRKRLVEAVSLALGEHGF